MAEMADTTSNDEWGLSVRISSAPKTGFPSMLESPQAKQDLLCSILPPAGGTRSATDVCCVVDVSGSMMLEAKNGDSESQGLSVLDVVKHACEFRYLGI